MRDQPIVIYECDNKKITNICRIVEPKDYCDKKCQNILILPGSLSTLDNNLFSYYDFLLAHSKKLNASPIRLFIFGQYEATIATDSKKTQYRPPSFDALGEMLKRSLEALNERYGKMNIIYAHSAGCKALASLLRRSGTEILPVLLHFDRGASSMFEIAKNYFLGRFLYLIPKCSGWALDLDKEIIEYFNQCKKKNANLQNSVCLITGVEEDHIFLGKSNLARNKSFDKITKELKFGIWMFNPPEQIVHSTAHHSWRLGNFNKSYLSLSKGNIEMLSIENLAECILRLSSFT